MSAEIKIERLPPPRVRARYNSIDAFCGALNKLKIGESFEFKTNSYHRLGLSWAQSLLGRRFKISGGRVWRVE